MTKRKRKVRFYEERKGIEIKQFWKWAWSDLIIQVIGFVGSHVIGKIIVYENSPKLIGTNRMISIADMINGEWVKVAYETDKANRDNKKENQRPSLAFVRPNILLRKSKKNMFGIKGPRFGFN